MLDTYEYAQRLQKDGAFTEQQARLLAQERLALEEHIMTRSDLANLVTKQDLSQALSQLELKLTLRMGAMQIAAIGILVAAMKLLIA
ncbi:hypothetical protein L861_14120 [Litchfieldella anticariensis FP35 = DSM 16096]|uniref:DUF1640 domain-containing protein n=1 Tax=Litchfieldella anticariensis (strain DSM 16096 / CECT 5854 / CIP 108499 / LMG 22089 / FP35) TaxID=1121939 RepID=S2L6U7_LITA3|nr:hypothetical protein [Halomonas anticariensis]EPC00406.1 hypothetical protein L861_14120 [Halomonas anticariensis FP35 = DSM 16096]